MYTLETLTDTVGNLTVQDRHTFFQVLTDNAELFNKVLPGLPLLANIVYGTPSDTIIVQSYMQWKNSN